jgi:hypothetical protein
MLSVLVVLTAAQQQTTLPTDNNNNSTFEVPDVYNISDPVVGATLEHFEVSSDTSAITKFACVDLGARCTYHRLNYDSVDFGTGQDTENTEGAVWAAVKEDAVLTLGYCTAGDSRSTTATSRANALGSNEDSDGNACVVTCNANCTCAYVTDDTMDDPQLCRTLSSRAPTPSPKTAAPVSKVCPQQQFADEFCPTLMQQQPSSIPEGTIQNYDCFNFCGGIWIDTCDIATGTCGTTQCDNATATGTLNGVVKGCTIEHYLQKSSSNNNPNNNNGSTGSSTKSRESIFVYLMNALVAIMVTGLLHM